MTHRKKLIETAIPLDDINRESAREKSIRHGHPSTLHLWWARRPLAACRAVLFSSLIDDPGSEGVPEELLAEMDRLPAPEPRPPEWESLSVEERRRQKVFRFIGELVKWENSSDERVLDVARAMIRAATNDNPPPALDPFAGGGSIPLEAQRLGLQAHGSDLNPVAVLITKALIEIPPKFAGKPPVNPESRARIGSESGYRGAQGLAEDVRYYGKWMRDEAERRIGHLYPKGPNGETVIAWLWARTVRCPNPACGARMPLVRSFWLSKKQGKKAWAEPVVDRQRKTVSFEVHTGDGEPPEPPKVGRGAKFRCLVCEQTAEDRHIKNEGQAGRMDQQLMAVVAEGHRGRTYLTPTDEHVAVAEKAEPEWRPDQELAGDRRAIWCPLYGLDTFDKLFTSRQLVALTTFSDLVGKAHEQARRDYLGARASSSQEGDAFEQAGRMPAHPQDKEPKGWHSRGYLPHFDGSEIAQSITFRLAGSLPQELLEREEKEDPEGEEAERRRRIEEHLDEGYGEAWLADPRIAELVENALLYFDGERYDLHGWVIMPNHVHVLVTPRQGHRLHDIIHSWKSYTANEANRVLERTGSFWQDEYFDRYIRDEEHFATALEYIEENPVKARLCPKKEDWRYSSASSRAARMAAPPEDDATLGLGPRPSWAQNNATLGTRPSWAQDNATPDEDATPLNDGGAGAQAYADAVATCLTFGISRLSNRASTICIWNTIGEKVEQTFARQAIPMTWDFAEANVLSSSTGSWAGSLEWVPEVLERAYTATDGEAYQLDAIQAVNGVSRSLISTDPPYYDNIGYADLSDFFYVWLRRSLGGIYPDILGTLLVPKKSELVATPYRFGGSKQKAQEFFEEGLGEAFARMREAASPDYPLTIYYAFKQAETDAGGDGTMVVASTGWESMLEGLISTGFQITGTWPMRTERPTGMKHMVNALASSIVLVCRPRPQDAPPATRREFHNALRRELPGDLKVMMGENIAPVDLAQATIGPGMAIYSRHAEVLEAGGSRMAVRAALQMINGVLDEILAEAEGDLDGDSRFCLAWFETRGHGDGPFGEADVLARARNTSVEGLTRAGVLASRGGKVRLLRREELPEDWDPSSDGRIPAWEATQHLVAAVMRGEGQAARVFAALGPEKAEAARSLSYRLYQLCERKKNAEDALAYNTLVTLWPDIVARAEEEKRQGRMF